MYGSIFSRPPPSPVILQFRPPAQLAAQMSKTVTLYICAPDCTVRCDYWLRFSQFSEKFNSRLLLVMSSLHFFNLLHLLACREPELGSKPFNE